MSHSDARYRSEEISPLREVVKILNTPPPLTLTFEGGGYPLNHNFLQKDLIFFLNFILEGHFEICWLKIACFRALYSELWAKQTTFGMKRGGGYLCSVDSCGAIAVN